jgi:pyruvate formate lyase activating enzyme
VQLKEIMDFILDDSDFYLASGGGVTISGGEPLLQAEFSAAIAAECKGHGIHVIIDTAGNVEYSAFSLVAPYTDVFYIDLKGATQDDYHEKTGGSFAVVLANMAGLTADGYAFVARIPVIPGYNDTVEYCGRMADLLLQTGCRQVHLLPFHKLGSGKYRALGLDWRCRDIEAPGMAQMQTLSRVFTEKGFATELES